MMKSPFVHASACDVIWSWESANRRGSGYAWGTRGLEEQDFVAEVEGRAFGQRGGLLGDPIGLRTPSDECRVYREEFDDDGVLGKSVPWNGDVDVLLRFKRRATIGP